jgi:transcriptional regulator GlxA family with amidase domain
LQLGLTIRRLIGQCMGQPTGGGLAPESRSVEQELLSLLEGLAKPEMSRPSRRGRINRHRAYQRALELASTRRFSLPIPMLAQQVGVSQRTLELAFHEAIGMPPSRYLRWARLNGLRRALLGADPETATTTELAVSWGFGELGRMSVEYRQSFGELPSLTLSRRPKSPATLLTPRLRSAPRAPEQREAAAAAL